MEKIRTNVEKETGDRIRDYDPDGVKVDEDFKRYYPYRDLASESLDLPVEIIRNHWPGSEI